MSKQKNNKRAGLYCRLSKDGKLTEAVNDRKFNDKFKAIVDKIVG